MELDIRELRIVDCIAASRLINEVAEIFIAPDFTPQGMNHFLAFTRSSALCERLENGALILGAWDKEQFVGLIEFREGPHIALLFTAASWQGRGIARKLLDAALVHYFRQHGASEKLTVNASLFAVPIYQKLGFSVSGPEQNVNGICFVPMERNLQQTQD